MLGTHAMAAAAHATIIIVPSHHRLLISSPACCLPARSIRQPVVDCSPSSKSTHSGSLLQRPNKPPSTLILHGSMRVCIQRPRKRACKYSSYSTQALALRTRYIHLLCNDARTHRRDLSIRGKLKSAAAASASATLATPRKSATGTPAAAKCSFCSSLSCARATTQQPVQSSSMLEQPFSSLCKSV